MPRRRPAAIAAFYGECDSVTAAWAAGQLRRQYWHYWEEENPLDAWPHANYRAIVATADRMVSIAWAHRVIPKRLGVEPIVVSGDHSPFLSAPGRLADALTAS